MATTDRITELATQDCASLSTGMKQAGSIYSENTIPELLSRALELSQNQTPSPSASPSNTSASKLAAQQLGRSA